MQAWAEKNQFANRGNKIHVKTNPKKGKKKRTNPETQEKLVKDFSLLPSRHYRIINYYSSLSQREPVSTGSSGYYCNKKLPQATQCFQSDTAQAQRSAHRDLAVSQDLTSIACDSARQHPQLALHHFAGKALHS